MGVLACWPVFGSGLLAMVCFVAPQAWFVTWRMHATGAHRLPPADDWFPPSALPPLPEPLMRSSEDFEEPVLGGWAMAWASVRHRRRHR